MRYSNAEIIKRVAKAKKEKRHLTHITDKTALSTEDKVKLSLCRHFVQFANSKRLKLKQIANMMGVPIQRLSEITNYKINKFTVDQLLKNLTLLAEHNAEIKEYLNFLESAAELPTLKITETRKLMKSLKQASRHGFSHANM